MLVLSCIYYLIQHFHNFTNLTWNSFLGCHWLKITVCIMREPSHKFSLLFAAMEICTPSQRNFVGTQYMMPWSLGCMLTAGVAYLVRPWRWLQSVYAAFYLVTLVYIWYEYSSLGYCI